LLARSRAAVGKRAIFAFSSSRAILAPILLGQRVVVAAAVIPVVERSQERLFPEGVSLVTRSDRSDDSELFPEELRAIARATPARQREFALGRRCAREALALLGGPRVAIPVGRFRDPVWPFGYVGSITHCQGFCAVAVARTLPGSGCPAIRGLGLDSEQAVSLSEELVGVVCSAQECEWLASRQGDGLPWDRLLFCAKRSAHKCLFPTTHRFLEFRDMGVLFDAEQGSFDVTLPSLYGSPSHLLGRYLIRNGLVLSATTWMDEPACP
jgi:Phosphopantetheinyl transferase component of siderophore synthetase